MVLVYGIVCVIWSSICVIVDQKIHDMMHGIKNCNL